MLYIEYKGSRNDFVAKYNRTNLPVYKLKSGSRVFDAVTEEGFHYFLRSNPELTPLVPTPSEYGELAVLRKAEAFRVAVVALAEKKRSIENKLNANISRAKQIDAQLSSMEARIVGLKDELKAVELDGVRLSGQLADLPEKVVKEKPEKKVVTKKKSAKRKVKK